MVRVTAPCQQGRRSFGGHGFPGSAGECTNFRRSRSTSAGAAQVYNHSVPEFASFFGPLELVPPGVVDAREWRPDWEQAVHLPPRDGEAIAGVARVG